MLFKKTMKIPTKQFLFTHIHPHSHTDTDTHKHAEKNPYHMALVISQEKPSPVFPIFFPFDQKNFHVIIFTFLDRLTKLGHFWEGFLTSVLKPSSQQLELFSKTFIIKIRVLFNWRNFWLPILIYKICWHFSLTYLKATKFWLTYASQPQLLVTSFRST